MNLQQLIQTKIEEFDEKFPCINADCDGKGNIPHQVSEDEWEAEQCQFCFEYRFAAKDFLESTILETAKLVVEETQKILENSKVWDTDYIYVRKAKLVEALKENARAMGIGE